jgi:hypothetical protein
MSYRMGVMSDLAGQILFVLLVLTLYRLLKGVSRLLKNPLPGIANDDPPW